MKVKVAETAGFCFGVKRAVDKVYQLIEEALILFIHWGRSSITKKWLLILLPKEYR